jgi:hypothetical protein
MTGICNPTGHRSNMTGVLAAMNRPRLVVLAAALLAAIAIAAPCSLRAQEQGRPNRGKIDKVEEEASGADDAPWFIRVIWDAGRAVWHLATFVARDRGPGQGYLDYPYSDPRAIEHFVLSDVTAHRSYGALAASYYIDAGSTLRGVHVAWEGARGVVSFNAEVDAFREPTATDVDHLTLVRVGATGLARLSHAVLVRSGLGVRTMILDDGSMALGPEFEAGLQAFPLRPLAFDGTFRVAGLSGAGAAWFGTALLEASAGVGVLLGRVELRAGYRALVIGSATTLAGPSLGARIWF